MHHLGPRTREPGRPNDPRWCSGRSCSSPDSRQTLPASVMPSIEWRSSGSAGATPGRQDRPQVAAPDGRQVATRERRVVGQVGDRLGEAVDQGRLLPLEQVEHAGGGRRVRAHQPATGDQRADQREREATDPEEGRVREQDLVGPDGPDLVEVVQVADQRAVGVDHALRRAGRARRVDDDHAVGRRDLGLGGAEHLVADRAGRLQQRAPPSSRRPTPATGAANLIERSVGTDGAMRGGSDERSSSGIAARRVTS